jgi:hypothetical protein
MDWYEIVRSGERVSQGDLILDCPLVAPQSDGDQRDLSKDEIEEDVLVATQNCDLAQGKAKDVLLCFCLPLPRFRENWQSDRAADGKSASTNEWKSLCENIVKGHSPNLAILDPFESEGLSTGHRVVLFNKVYPMPLDYIQAEVRQRDEPRLRLVSPFREHISQSFARCYMRVPLPDDRPRGW